MMVGIGRRVLVSTFCLAAVTAITACARPRVAIETTQAEEVTTATPDGLVTEVIPAAPLPEEAEVPAAAEVSEAVAVREIKLIEDNGQRGIFTKLSRPAGTLEHVILENPTRLVIDVEGPVGAGTSSRTFPVKDAVVSSIRMTQHEGNLRLSIALHTQTPPQYSVTDLNATVVAFLGEPEGNTEPVREQVVFSQRRAEVAEALPAAPSPAPTPVSIAAPARREDDGLLVRRVEQRAYTGPRVSLDFKDADVHNVLRLLAEVSKLNLVATDDVKGKLTLRLFDVPWEQALDIVLQVLGLESVQQGNVIRISTVRRLREEREELVKAKKAARDIEPLHAEYLRVNYAKASKLAEILGASPGGRGGGSEGGILTERGRVLVDEFTNTLIVRDVQRGVDSVREMVRQLDVQTPQILIESSIVEVTKDFAQTLGIQWGYRASIGPQTGTSTGVNFPGTIAAGGAALGSGTGGVPFIADFPAGGNFGPGSGSALDLALGSLNGANSLDVRLTALEEAGKGKIISRPRVSTLNNIAATIKSLTILRVKLPSTGTVINTGAGGAAGGGSTATEKIETGITLVVTPQVSSDGFVMLDMFAKSSQADFTRTVDDIPTEISREANSHVLIKDGQTVVLGGIFREQLGDRRSGMPFLSDVPGLGWLFRVTDKQDRREDLLIFLTPRVLGGVNPTLPTGEQLWRDRGEAGFPGAGT